jgi:2-dehydro-3-deoxygluconokinase
MGVLYPPEPVTLDDTGTLLLDIGGAEANLSVALARLGHSVRYISRVGADPFGERIRNTLAAEGVDVSGVRTDQVAPTGVFFREWLPDGARRVYYYRAGSAASRMQPDDLDPQQFAGARFVHLTGITPALSQGCAATVARAVELARAAGAQVSFDPNYRAKLWSPEAARAALAPILMQCDVLLMGHEDAEAVLGHFDDEQQLLEMAASLGPAVVVLKRAERGALALAGGQRYEAPAVPVERVIDPVGAGDGFDAGFLAGLLRGDDTPAALALGARVGAASVAALGDYAGYPREPQQGA